MLQPTGCGNSFSDTLLIHQMLRESGVFIVIVFVCSRYHFHSRIIHLTYFAIEYMATGHIFTIHSLTRDLFRVNKQRKCSLYLKLSVHFGKTKMKQIPATFITCRSFIRSFAHFSCCFFLSTVFNKLFVLVRVYTVQVYYNACQLK